ncbi:MAG: methyl-accepting chemotaxis protein [Nitrospiria bacterium]
MGMNWTIKMKLIGLAVCAGFFAAAIGGVGFLGLAHVDETFQSVVVSGHMMRDHLESDMMHDAIRGDVLAALLASKVGKFDEKTAIEGELQEHIAWFDSKIEKLGNRVSNGEVSLEVSGAYPKVKANLEKYKTAAIEIVSLAFTDIESALQQEAEFDVVYEALEGEMSAMSDLIEAGVATSEENVEQQFSSTEGWLLFWITVTLLALSIISYLIIRSISTGLTDLTAVVEAISSGDLSSRVTSRREDEIGHLSKELNKMAITLSNMVSGIKESSADIAATSVALSEASGLMSSNTDETLHLSESVSASGEEASHSIETVATSTEEMSSTIQEISGNIQSATRITAEAVTMAESANMTVSKLGDSSTEIGHVIKVITAIAQQTNLLALNATIEAARAGEAGKGFAVVANEVKDLAKATAKATEEINVKITAIQSDTTGAVTAIGEIEKVIHQINEISTNIAGAIEEQSATTNEISRSISGAADGAREISTNIEQMVSGSKGTSEKADEVKDVSEDLARLGNSLKETVAWFKE